MLRRAIENPLLPQCVGSCKGLTIGELRITIGSTNIGKHFRPALRLALYEHEKQQIPNTMAAVAAVKRQEQAKEDLKVLSVKLAEMEQRVRAVQQEQRDLEYTYHVTKNLAETRTLKEVQCATRCQKADCVGFTNHLGTCLVCHSPHCAICGVNVEGVVESHECNPDDVASLTEIRKTAKPCPSCGAPTTRISGCPQMWCTYCRTGYNYKSLTINRGHVDNPHHNDYLRSLSGTGAPAREPGDVPCGGFEMLPWNLRHSARLTFCRLHPMALSVVPGYAEAYGNVLTMLVDDWWNTCHSPPFRALTEKMTSNSDRLQRRIRSSTSQLTELRVQHIMKRIEDEDYMTKLVRLDTARRRDAELSPVMSLYVEMLQDYDRQWIALYSKAHDIDKALQKDNKERTAMQKWGKKTMELFQRLLQIQETVQEGLDAGAAALGIKRLGKICPDGIIRLN